MSAAAAAAAVLYCRCWAAALALLDVAIAASCCLRKDGRSPGVWVTSAASASAVSAGPAAVLRGLRRCLSTSGRGMMEPEASLPTVTRTCVVRRVYAEQNKG